MQINSKSLFKTVRITPIIEIIIPIIFRILIFSLKNKKAPKGTNRGISQEIIIEPNVGETYFKP